MFECLVFMESGTVCCIDNKIYPETKIVKDIQFINETSTIEEANARIDELLDQYFGIYGHKGEEGYDEFYRKENQVYNNDSWVLLSVLPAFRWIPELNDDHENKYIRHTYKRFYWILKNASQNYLPATIYEYKDSASETSPIVKGGD